MLETIFKIKDIIMVICGLIGMFLVGYIRVSFSTRQQKTPEVQLDYNDKEKKLRRIAIILLAMALVLAAIPVGLFTGS